jgi:hypothetical protein
MRAFTCGVCGQLVFFENSACLRCGTRLGLRWSDRELVTKPGQPPCANSNAIGCNALADTPGAFCFACTLTRTRPDDADGLGRHAVRVSVQAKQNAPDDADGHGLSQWAEAERAKRRLIFELGELGLPLPTRAEQPDGGLAFDLLSSAVEPVMTGHANGVITLDLAESDDDQRERRRVQMGEPYRTLLGHLRHEIGHFYFPLLTTNDEALATARRLFGDERENYQQALDRHYAAGPPDGWAREHVSAYATMHPSEDWAETFAHVLHVRDTLQTAAAYGVRVDGPAGRPDLHAAPVDTGAGGLRAMLDDWLGLTYALNAVNRSLGFDDLYPFVLSPPVIDKLAFVDGLIARS